jgi:hypothetical protein
MRIRRSITALGAGALVLIAAGSAVAGTGGNLILGHSNSATKTTTLSNSKGTPLSLKAKKGHAPLQVNSSKVVKNLNSDLLDGASGGSFQRKVTGACTGGKAATAVSSNSLTCASVAAPVSHVIDLSAGTTATTNGTELKAVLAAITDATATDGYLIKLGPGVFDVGTSALTVPSYVDLRGAGEYRTTITAAVSTAGFGADLNTGTVVINHSSSLRSLSITNTATSVLPIAQIGLVVTGAGGPVSLEHVAVTSVTGDNVLAVAVEAGSTMVATDLTVAATGSAEAEGARADNASTLSIDDSTLTIDGGVETNSVATSTGSTVQVVDTQMPAAESFTDASAGATVTCFGDYTAALAAVPSTC